MQTFIDMANELDEVTVMKHREEASGIAFNPKDYKAKREVRILHVLLRLRCLRPIYDNLCFCNMP